MTMSTYNMGKLKESEERISSASELNDDDGQALIIDLQNWNLFISENLVDLLGLLVEPDMYHANSLDAAVSEDAVDALNLILEGSIDNGSFTTARLYSAAENSDKYPSDTAQHGTYWSSATLDGAILKIHRAHCSYLYLLSPMRSVTLDKCRKLTIVLGPIENTLQLNNCEDCLVISACRRAILVACRRCTMHLCTPSRPILIQSNLPSNLAVGSGGTSAPSTPVPNGALSGNEEILLAPFHTTYTRLADHMARVNLSVKVNYWDKPFILGQQDSNRQEFSQQTPNSNSQLGRGRVWDLLRPCHFYPFNIPLLLPPGRATGESTLGDESGGELAASGGRRKSVSAKCSLDLSASLVTDTSPYFAPQQTSENQRIKSEAEYMAMATSRLVIPLPPVYLSALRERALVYQKWPQHISGARLTSEQRQMFGSLVDQRFRKWLFESGNLRQLQLLELSTSQTHHNSQSTTTTPDKLGTSAVSTREVAQAGGRPATTSSDVEQRSSRTKSGSLHERHHLLNGTHAAT